MSTARLPSWERLRAPDRRRLEVGPVRRVATEDVLIDDGDLPDHGGATVFDAWRAAGGEIIVRAAAIEEISVTPYELRAQRLRIERSDGRLEALLAGSGAAIVVGGLERLACACRGISVDAVYAAIGRGWATAEAIKRATRLGFGVCQGRRCIPWLAERLEMEVDDPLAQVTPRPPLVPVPASILAAYADVALDGRDA